MSRIFPLNDVELDIERAGKKAGQLHSLASAGFPVPRGFVVFFDRSLGDVTDAELAEGVGRVGGWPVAVRSSACLEDLPGASFAGQYESSLGVADLATLRQRIEDCRASAGSERVRTYLRKAGLDEAAVGLSVLVQKMVDARVAGVAFTLAPDTGREEHALVECCPGLGHKLVSGQVTPCRYVVRLEAGEAVEENPGSDGTLLSAEELRRLSSLLLEVQAHCGAPQDVEWVMDRAGALHVVQSRPITRVQWRSDMEELTNADLKDGGISARACTPLMFSLYRNAVEDSFQNYFKAIKLLPRSAPRERWLFHFYGRGYWNASAVKRALKKVPGFDERAFDEDIGIQKQYGAEGPVVVRATFGAVARALPVAVALEVSFARQLKEVETFRTAFAVARERFLSKIQAFSDTADQDFGVDLDRVLHELHRWTEQTYFTTIYNNSNAQTDFRSFIEKLDRATGGHTSVVALIGGLSDVSHMAVQRGILKLYRIAQRWGTDSTVWRQEQATFLAQNFFHGDAELDLTVPRWGEVPDRIRAMVDGMLTGGAEPTDPDQTAALQRRRYTREVEEVERRLGARLTHRLRFLYGFRKRLRRVRSYLRRREEMRQYSMQCYSIVRHYVLEAGQRLAAQGRLARADDVFMLSTQELVQLFRGDLSADEVQQPLRYRRLMYEGYRDFVPPNEFGRGVQQRDVRSYIETSAGRIVLQGTGCSPGRAEGTVRVIRSLEEIDQLKRGDILVTRFTDPGWTPALGLVAAVVTEVGGMLSHAAVIGREYGIPAVLNLPAATTVLHSGQRIGVDGTSGQVVVLDSPAEIRKLPGLGQPSSHPSVRAPTASYGKRMIEGEQSSPPRL